MGSPRDVLHHRLYKDLQNRKAIEEFMNMSFGQKVLKVLLALALVTFSFSVVALAFVTGLLFRVAVVLFQVAVLAAMVGIVVFTVVRVLQYTGVI